MKTKEEVLKHLAETGYTMKAMNRIFGYLLGIGMIENDEDINIKHGEHKWADFLTWMSSVDKLSVVNDMLFYFAGRSLFAGAREQEEIDKFINFLVDEYGVEDGEDNDKQ